MPFSGQNDGANLQRQHRRIWAAHGVGKTHVPSALFGRTHRSGTGQRLGGASTAVRTHWLVDARRRCRALSRHDQPFTRDFFCHQSLLLVWRCFSEHGRLFCAAYASVSRTIPFHPTTEFARLVGAELARAVPFPSPRDCVNRVSILLATINHE